MEVVVGARIESVLEEAIKLYSAHGISIQWIQFGEQHSHGNGDLRSLLSIKSQNLRPQILWKSKSEAH